MRYVQLRAFHNVAIHDGFSRAAEALGLTQPAISDQVRKLESEYDIRLFDRQKKQIRLTESGKQLLDITNRLFEIETQAMEFLSETQSLKTGTLKIFADSAHHILHVLAQFRHAHPAVSVSINTGNTASVITRLQNYEADIGVVGKVPEGREFEVVALSSSPIVAFVSRNNRLAKSKALSLCELCRHPLVLREEGSLTRALLEDELARKSIRIAGAIEAEGREAVQEIVAADGGIGFVSQAEFGNDHRLVKLDIADASMIMDEAIICLRERSDSKAIRTFMTIARQNTSTQS
jgi:aminoethylphosphonate catabolism LysR family transcriptional regulator